MDVANPVKQRLALKRVEETVAKTLYFPLRVIGPDHETQVGPQSWGWGAHARGWGDFPWVFCIKKEATTSNRPRGHFEGRKPVQGGGTVGDYSLRKPPEAWDLFLALSNSHRKLKSCIAVLGRRWLHDGVRRAWGWNEKLLARLARVEKTVILEYWFSKIDSPLECLRFTEIAELEGRICDWNLILKGVTIEWSVSTNHFFLLKKGLKTNCGLYINHVCHPPGAQFC